MNVDKEVTALAMTLYGPSYHLMPQFQVAVKAIAAIAYCQGRVDVAREMQEQLALLSAPTGTAN